MNFVQPIRDRKKDLTDQESAAWTASRWSDVPLSELSIQQSKELALEIKDQKFDAVFASDLRRTTVTAAPDLGQLE